MPKAKWGAGDTMLTADDIAGAEVPESRARYSGPLPPAGTYRFVIQSIKQGVSNEGNNKIVIFMTIDGTWQPHHAQYEGAPVWHHLALTKKNAGQVRNFLEALGATPEDLLNGSVVDENEYITKLGKLGDPAGLLLYVNARRSKTTREYPDPRLEVAYAGYLPVNEVEDETGTAPEDGTGDGEEPPF